MLPTIEEIKKTIVFPNSILIPELQGYTPLPGLLGPLQYSGGFSVVFPFSNGTDTKALRIWHKEIPQIHQRTIAVSSFLSSLNDISYFVNYRYIPNCVRFSPSVLLDAVLMDWVDGETLKDYINDVILSDSLLTSQKQDALKKLSTEFYKMFKVLHHNHVSHGDLQHGNIIIQSSNQIRLLDYDSFYVPSLGNSTPQVTTGFSGYQHPARFKSRFSSEKDDYFSELIIITSLLALSEDLSLWNDFSIIDNEYSLLFTSRDFSSFPESAIYKRLQHCTDAVKELLMEIERFLKIGEINRLSPIEEVLSRHHLLQLFDSEKDVFCIKCGTRYLQGDNYCIICGNQRN